ncbi:MAG: sulfotransferase family 2 domain-containing protein [Gammaproteobacteria bacterium]|nr:sulfotransferase family 2 domain-containing protein [Gammaproteobacteria bacterium]
MSSMIMHKHRSIFIHVNKAGGTTVENLLAPFEEFRFVKKIYRGTIRRASFLNGFKGFSIAGIDFFHPHASALDIRSVIGEEKFNSYFKFAIVRNPWDIELSRYFFARKARAHKLHSLANSLSFKEFLRWRESKGLRSRQIVKLCDEDENIIVDQIVKIEMLDKELPKLLGERFGFSIEGMLPRLNVSKNRTSYKEYYDQESVQIVERLNSKDIERFGYTY